MEWGAYKVKMDGKTCCFIGHREIKCTDKLKNKIEKLIRELVNKGVITFLFGSNSQFDDLCHQIVTELQKENSHIKRIMFTRRSEYAVKKGEKAELEEGWSKLLKKEVKLKDYEGEMMSDRLWSAGKASYVERNQDMINLSDYAMFYYDPYYQPPRRKYSKLSVGDYQPKSGTQLALDYAYQRKRGGKDITIINVYEEENEN